MDNLHFTVSGEWLTQFARERFKETNDIQVGILFLTSSLIGFPEDLALDVVKGKKKLTGENEVLIEEDNTRVIPYGCVTPKPITDVLCGWISPDGEVYGVSKYTMTTEHNDLARDIVNADLVEYNGFSDYSSVEDAGFIKFSPHLCCSYTKPGNITQKQKDLILEYMLSHDILLYQIGYGSSERVLPATMIKSMELMRFAMLLTGKI